MNWIIVRPPMTFVVLIEEEELELNFTPSHKTIENIVAAFVFTNMKKTLSHSLDLLSKHLTTLLLVVQQLLQGIIKAIVSANYL